MKERNIFGWLLGMIVLGAIGLSLVGWLVAHRTGQPLSVGPAAPASASAAPGTALTQGGSRAAELAAQYLADGERRRGAHAMDAAMRAAELGKHAFDGNTGKGFARGLKKIKEGRHALQMGRREEAVHALSQAADMLGQLESGERTRSEAGTRYEGATLLNAQGVRIGEITSVNASRVSVTVGGMQDFLGFIDLGGVELVVEVEDMIFGKAQTIGSTMVALPTTTTEPAAIRAAVASR